MCCSSIHGNAKELWISLHKKSITLVNLGGNFMANKFVNNSCKTDLSKQMNIFSDVQMQPSETTVQEGDLASRSHMNTDGKLQSPTAVGI